MQIAGFQKTTLLDYPNHVAATVFLGSCNFRCPFCHNKDLVLHPYNLPGISMDYILSYLHKRKNILDGICITGGEPTLYNALTDFIKKVRQLDLKIKLDTNGYEPDTLIHLCESGLIDYVAMDVKGTMEKYPQICGFADLDIKRIKSSVDFLINSKQPFEFRTTIIKEFHSEQDFNKIGKWLEGAPAYYLQRYKDSDQVIAPGFTPYTKIEMEQFRSLLLNYIPKVELRGTADGE